MLDVGSGVGHWGRLVASLLSPDATVVGVEPDAGWVAEATRRAPPGFSYVQGVAESLPFADATFDLVTCQTVLIHVADPRAAIREMLRVVKPGGQLVVAEPNNQASYVAQTSSGLDVVDALTFVAFCERGKIALGEGDNSAGDLVPGYFALEGLVDVEAWIADKPAAMIPPYARDDMQAFKASMIEQARDGTMGLDARGGRALLRGGRRRRTSTPPGSAGWPRAARPPRRSRPGTFHTAGGMLMYVIAGRRPPQ